ncbi:MAG: sedoheptulose 7-phosphate cyclase [Solirubrobacterales bacterium]
MIIVKGDKPYSYSIKKTQRIFDPDNDALLMGGDTEPGTRRFVVVDANVYRLYKTEIGNYFAQRGVDAKIALIDSGDKQKSETSYISLFSDLCDYDVRRRSEPLIAIGGGVVTDLAGFVASTYRRGVPHIKVPTTLMGYVDASVGIKTGVNFGPFKNRMGSFEIPAGVILDKSFLKTLDRRNLANGVGEIVKLAVITDASLFHDLEQAKSTLYALKFQDALGQVILDKSIQGMVHELSPNLYETDLQRKVDFGHTFSLAIESASGYEIMHGEAVAIDVLFSSFLSLQRGILPQREYYRIVGLYRSLGLPMWSPNITPDLFWNGVQERVMHRDGKQLIPIPTAIGECAFLNDLEWNEVRSAVAVLEREHLEWRTA